MVKIIIKSTGLSSLSTESKPRVESLTLTESVYAQQGIRIQYLHSVWHTRVLTGLLQVPALEVSPTMSHLHVLDGIFILSLPSLAVTLTLLRKKLLLREQTGHLKAGTVIGIHLIMRTFLFGDQHMYINTYVEYFPNLI